MMVSMRVIMEVQACTELMQPTMASYVMCYVLCEVWF